MSLNDSFFCWNGRMFVPVDVFNEPCRRCHLRFYADNIDCSSLCTLFGLNKHQCFHELYTNFKIISYT